MSIVDRALEFRRNIEEEPIVHFHKVSLAKLRALEELPEEIPSEDSVKSAVRSMVLDKLDHLAITRIGRAIKYDANTDNPLNGIEDDLERWKKGLHYHKKQGTSKGRAQTDGTHFSAEEIRNFVEKDEETLIKESVLVAVHKNYYLSGLPILPETSPYSSHAHDITAAYNLILPDSQGLQIALHYPHITREFDGNIVVTTLTNTDLTTLHLLLAQATAARAISGKGKLTKPMTIDLSYINTDNITWVDRKIENGAMRAESVDFDTDTANQTAQKLAQASKTWPENKDKIKEVFNKRKKSWIMPHENGDFLTPIQSKLL